MTGHGGVITVQLGGLSVTAACIFSKGTGNLKRDQKIGFLFSLKLFPHVGNKKEHDDTNLEKLKYWAGARSDKFCSKRCEAGDRTGPERVRTSS